MNLRQLKIFMKVCETENMSEAGRQLHMTQPAISQTIKKLEEELNIKLFERIHNRLGLTYPGEVLLKYCKKIILLVEEAEDSIEYIANMEKGKLRIGASTTIGTYLLPDLINKFNKIYRVIELPLIIDNTDFIVEKIINNEIDVGMVEGPVKSSELIIRPYLDDELILVCSSQHRWAQLKERVVEPAEFAEEDMIIREEGSGTRKVIENIMQQNNLSYKIKHVLNNLEAIKKAVEVNIGISILPAIAVKEELKENKFIKIKISGVNFMRKLYVIYHQDKFHSRLFDKFIDFLYETKA